MSSNEDVGNNVKTRKETEYRKRPRFTYSWQLL